MPAISDSRRLRVFRAKSVRGELLQDPGCDVWQTPDGKVMVSGTWEGVLVVSQEDLEIQARELVLSPLELLRQKLACCPGVAVEVMDYAKA